MTTIEWVRNQDGTQGITVNTKTGCLNHLDGLCQGGYFPCYAYKLANRRLRTSYLMNSNIAKPIVNLHDAYTPYTDPFYPRMWPSRLEKIRKIKKPTGLFLDDMSDWMADYWPESYTEQEIQVMRDCPHIIFYTLTKQPQNLAKWSPFPDNCRVGVTATSPFMLYKAFEFIKTIDASVVYLSIEPLLQEIKIPDPAVFNEYGTSWLIIGACTGNKPDMEKLCQRYPDLTLMPWRNKWTAQPKLDWVEEIVEAADRAGIPVFLKENLKGITMPASEVTKHHNLAATTVCVDQERNLWRLNDLRQEMPK